MPGLSYLTKDGGLDYEQMTNVAKAVGGVSERGRTDSQYAVALAKAGLEARADSLPGNDWQGEKSQMLKYADSLSALNNQKMTRSGRMAALRSVLAPLGAGMNEMDELERRKRRMAAGGEDAGVAGDTNMYTNTATGLGIGAAARQRMQNVYEGALASRRGVSPASMAQANAYARATGQSEGPADPLRIGRL